jgi:hypothetical protein
VALAAWTLAVASSFETIALGEAAAGRKDTACWLADQLRICAELMERPIRKTGVGRWLIRPAIWHEKAED